MVINMYKAIIFDNDGLMIDSENATYEEYVIYLKEMGLSFPKELYLTFLGKNKPLIREIFLKHYGLDFPFETVWDDVHVRLDQRLENNLPIKPGLLELISYLKENKYKIAIATSSDRNRIDRILKDLTDQFDYIICGDEVSKGKPDPEIFLKACEKLGVHPSQALVLEDSESGILAAYNGNIDVICIPDMKYPQPEFEKHTKAILKNLTAVIDYLKKD